MYAAAAAAAAAAGGYATATTRPDALRAWLRDAQAAQAAQAAQLLAPADVVVCVGAGPERHFAAHRAVLAAHSGYLKAALLVPGPPPPALALPNLSPEAFAPLLAFMYSGFLDLSHHNIYSVLLAAHLLHMPRALDHCRAFLLHASPSSPPSPLPSTSSSRPLTPPSIVRPVPSRKLLPPLLLNSPWHPSPLSTGAAAPSTPPLVPSSRGCSLFRAPAACTAVSAEEDNSSSEICVTETPPPPADPAEHLLHLPQQQQRDRRVVEEPREAAPAPLEAAAQGCKPRVVLDVACCDGPVRFHRVLNTNYGLGLDELLPHAKQEDTEDEAEEDEARHREERAGKPSEEGAAATVYKCLYCQHTFKSHYCYQKHTRRHINPVTLDLAKLADRLKSELLQNRPTGAAGVGGGVVPAATAAAAAAAAAGSGTGEVRLLDMNVQYYPCKTCGSKFPSYYFVHKHRRQCHPSECEAEAKEPKSSTSEGSVTSQQPREPTPPAPSTSE